MVSASSTFYISEQYNFTNRFDFIILVFISANCITLAMERPNIPPWSLERKILSYLNHVFTIVFAIEMVLKAIANCYVFGETAYFKDNWNRMDGTLVIISLVGELHMISSVFQVSSLSFTRCHNHSNSWEEEQDIWNASGFQACQSSQALESNQ